MFELAGTDPYEGDPLTCERMCNPDVNASADDKTANACDGNSGFVTSGRRPANAGKDWVIGRTQEVQARNAVMIQQTIGFSHPTLHLYATVAIWKHAILLLRAQNKL